jgi:vacuolar-type H+-ATPase subunit D/Vma8
VLGGAGELREVAAAARGATVTCRWQSQMGVDYPDMASAEAGRVPDVTTTAAFGPAIVACQAALIAATEHAAAELALDRIEQAAAETRRRRRAVVKRLVPRLRDQLRRVEVDLDEAEREEATRIRLAVDRTGDPT